VLIGNFEVSKQRALKNPHEYLDKLMRSEILAEITRSLESQKRELAKQYKRSTKALAEYRKHFMVAYDDKWTALTKGVEWLKMIARDCLKYQYQTVFLNLPPFYDLSPEELVAAHDACTNSDLFICSSFVQPGVQTLLVLDNRFNEETGMLEEVVYAKDAIIERMTEDLAKLSSSEAAELTDYLTTGAVGRYEAIRA